LFLNNRHYDPSTGVFVSVDPLVSKTMQPYIYGSANPITYSDPSGLCAGSEVFDQCVLNDGTILDQGTSRNRSWLAKDGHDGQMVAGFLEQLQTGDGLARDGVNAAADGTYGGEAILSLTLFDRYVDWGLIVADPLQGGHGMKWWSCSGNCGSTFGDPVSGHMVGMTSGAWETAVQMGLMSWYGLQMGSLPVPVVRAPRGNGYPTALGRGSTGSAQPMNLQQQMAINRVMADPGGRQLRTIVLKDPRWPASDGWVKMTHREGGVDVHYVRNTVTGAVDDFKIVGL